MPSGPPAHLPQYTLLWWRGLEHWYNNRDYLQAVDDFQAAVDCFQWEDDNTEEEEEEEDAFDCIRALCRDNGDSNNSHLKQDKEKSDLAPLLLFLSGCRLDAEQPDKARRCLVRCLRIVDPSRQSLPSPLLSMKTSLFIKAVQELLHSFEDSIHQQADERAMEQSRKVVEWAMEKLPTVHWRNSYQRPGFLDPSIVSKPVYIDNDNDGDNNANNNNDDDDDDEIEERPTHTDGETERTSPPQRPQWASVLEENYNAILQEYIHLAGGGKTDRTTLSLPHLDCHHYMPSHWPSVGDAVHRDGAGAHDGSVVNDSGAWHEAVLWGAGGRPSLAPFTSGMLRQYAPDAVHLAETGGGEVLFSVLAPGTHIRPHCGTTNLRLTAHLGLVVPPSESSESVSTGRCAIRVADRWHEWKPGKVLIFDDSYEHEVRNDSDQVRVVLLIRFWHPHADRNALEEALEAKHSDGLSRYNPPTPRDGMSGDGKVTDRAMERTKCEHCWGTGYQSLHVVGVNEERPMVICSCGAPINDAEQYW